MLENKQKIDNKTFNLLIKLRIILEELIKERENNSEINTKILDLDSLILEKEEEIKNLNIEKNDLNSKLSIEISKSDIKKVNLNKVVNSIFNKESDNNEKIKKLENEIENYSNEKKEIEEKIKNENENFNKKNEEFENEIKNFENDKKKLQIELEELKLKQINLMNEKKEINFNLENVQKIQKENEKILNDKREIIYHNNIKDFNDELINLKEKHEELKNTLKNLQNEEKNSTDKIVKINEEINEKLLKEKSFLIKITENNFILKRIDVIKKLIFKKNDKNFEILIQSKENNNFKTTEIINMNLIEKFENDNENNNIYTIFYFDEKSKKEKTFKFEIHKKLSNIFFKTMRNFHTAALKIENKDDF